MIEVLTIVCDGNIDYEDAVTWLDSHSIDSRPVVEIDAIEAFVDSEVRKQVVAVMYSMGYAIIEGE